MRPSQPAIIPPHALGVGTTFTAAIDYRNMSGSDLNPIMDDVRASTGADASSVQPGLSHTIEVHIVGTMELGVIGRDGDQQLMRLRMSQPKIALLSDGAAAEFEAGNIAACLAKGAEFSLTARGKVDRIWIRPACGAAPGGTVKALVALLQFVVPEPGAANMESWETQEEDQTGRYEVRYSRQAASKAVTAYRKEKSRFLPPKAKTVARQVVLPVSYRPQGGADFGFDPASGQLLSVNADESYTVIINGKDVGTSKTTLSLKRTGLAKMAAATQKALLKQHMALARAVAATPLGRRNSAEQSDRLLYRQRLGTDTAASLLAELSAAERAGNKNFNDTDLYQKFKALIYLHPESCKKLARVAAAGNPDGLASRVLIRAMATIGSPAAQDAIVEVMRARAKDASFVMSIIPVLGMFDEPAAGTETALKRLAYHSNDQDIAFTAQLALGAMAGNLAEDDPERAQHIIDEFMSKYPSPSETQDISRVILVLSNARMEKYLPTLKMYAAHSMPEARSDAMYALRFFPGESVETILIHALTLDSDATTRFEAATSLRYMEASDRVVAALEGAYAKEQVGKIRIEILKSLWRSVRQHTEIRQIVQQAAEKDESDEVKKAARQILDERQPQ